MHTTIDPALRDVVRQHLGDVEVRIAERGFSSDFAGIAEGTEGRAFVKAMRNREGGRLASLRREEGIAPYLGGVAPDLLWSAESEDWLVLGFEVVDGRTASFAPGSADLPEVVAALDSVSRLPLPTVAQDWYETRWSRFTHDEEAAALLRGDSLLHTDVNPSNFLVAKERTWMVDWAWPTRGAGLIAPACLVVQFVSAGHSAAAAEAWAAGCAAWRDADPHAVDAFAAATARMHRFLAERRGEAWLCAMAAAAESWAAHRGAV